MAEKKRSVEEKIMAAATRSPDPLVAHDAFMREIFQKRNQAKERQIAAKKV